MRLTLKRLHFGYLKVTQSRYPILLRPLRHEDMACTQIPAMRDPWIQMELNINICCRKLACIRDVLVPEQVQAANIYVCPR
jgi:hypothetical protein